MKKLTLLFASIMMASLVGCTTTKEECDPRIKDPSILDKLGCVLSGSYEQRAKDKQQEIADLRDEQKRLSDEVIALNEKRPAMLKNRETRLKELDALKVKLSDLESDLKAKKALNAQLQEKLNSAKKAADDAYALDEDASTLEKKQKLKKVQEDMDEILDAMAESF